MSDASTCDMVVIGSGPAGQRAAIQAAKLGKRVALIERREVVGGVCVNSGTIPSKTLREAGLLKVLFHRESRKVLGVHGIGTGATELIHIGQAVMAHEGTIDYFVRAVFNYPTLAECYKVAALDGLDKLES